MSEVKEHIRDISGRSDSPESCGGDSIERGAEYVAVKTKDAVKDVGGRVRRKAENKVRDKLKERLEKEDTREPNHAEREPEVRSQRVKANESAESPEQPKRAVRERPGTSGEKHVKTKEEYIRSQGRFENPKKEVRQNASVRSNSAVCKKQPEISDTTKTARGNRLSRPVSNSAKQADKGSVKTAEKGVVKTVRKGAVKTAQSAGKASVKTAKAGVKTAERTVRTASKTAKAAAKAASKAAQAAAKAARVMARTAVKAAQLAIKAAAAAAKAIAAAVKALIAAIAAGGWVAVVIILAVALVAVILCACFGVFASNETEDGSKPMTEAIQTIDTEFKAGIDERIAELSAGDYESVTVNYAGDMDGDSDYIVNWNDVIAVYAVRVTMDDTAPADVVQVTPEKIEVLKQTFNDMNSVSYETEVVTTEETVENEEGEEETVAHQSLVIHVTVNSMEYTQAADLYAFDDYKRQALKAMMEPRMILMYAELTGVDLYGGSSAGDLTDIVSGLPPGEKGTAIVNAALTRIGDPYSQPKRGSGRYVDCSYLAWWAYREAGISIPSTSVEQAKWCYEKGYAVGKSELQPGDLVFWTKTSCRCGRWNEIHHVGIYIGNGRCIEASSGKGRVVVRKLWEGKNYELFLYARPA